jgi:hypothetical protein
MPVWRNGDVAGKGNELEVTAKWERQNRGRAFAPASWLQNPPGYRANERQRARESEPGPA